MPFEPGHKLSKGRPKGSGNKATVAIREAINNFLLKKLPLMDAKWDEMEPRDQLNFLKDLMRYAVPSLAAAEMTSPIESLPENQLKQLRDALLSEMRTNTKSNGREEE